MKRVRVDTYAQVNKAVINWFTRLRSENVPVSSVLIKEQSFAEELNVEN